MEQYDDYFLFDAFDDIMDWRNTGWIKNQNSNIKKIKSDYIKLNPEFKNIVMLSLIESFILTELARRYRYKDVDDD
jgi:hypothetical protein